MSAERMRPFFPYFGSKYRMARHYPEPVGHLVEPFAGSACYATYFGVERATLLDLDPNIQAVWRFLLSATADDIWDLPDLPAEGDTTDGLDSGPAALIGFWLTKSAAPARRRGAYAARPEWRHLFWRPEVKERIATQLPRIQGWRFDGADFEQAPTGADTYFIDPPYQRAGGRYQVRFTDYERLAAFAHRMPGRVIVCEGDGAAWMPFKPMGEFKTFASGSSPEMVYVHDRPTADATAAERVA